MNDILTSVLIFLSGAAASFINMMAGGGSLITVGVMILLGIEPAIANGTNRIGVLVGTTSGAIAFKHEKLTNFKQSILLGLCAIPGAIIGSYYSISINNELFKKLLSLVMIFILITLFIPKKKVNIERLSTSPWIYPAMFIVGLYGGFIQIGVGFILMGSIRHLMSLDLIQTNMHKVFVVLIYTIPVLIVFGISGKIDWWYALIMSAGNAIGSWISVKLAVKKGEKFVKFILALAVIGMIIKFFI